MNGPSDSVIAELQRWHSSHPTDAEAALRLAVALLARGRHDAAIRAIPAALASPRTRFQALKLLADTYDAKGMIERGRVLRQRLARELGRTSG